MRRFTMFRRGDLSATHNPKQVNAPDDPQFEGVVFGDGVTVIHWLTKVTSTSVWNSLADALAIHGHPEERYRSELVWHDQPLSVVASTLNDCNDPQCPDWLRIPGAHGHVSNARPIRQPNETCREGCP